jgi:hypothetical protein
MDIQLTAIGATSASTVISILGDGSLGIGAGCTPGYLLHVLTDSAGKPGAGGLWTVVSDERLKENIRLADLDLCYNAVKSIPLKRFTWKDDCFTEKQIRDRSACGWLAQDVQKVFPKAVNTIKFTKPLPKGADENFTPEIIEDCLDLNSGQILAALYGAVQMLITKVENLEAR